MPEVVDTVAIQVSAPEIQAGQQSYLRAARDQEILIARRLDWRFLLPSPVLNHVVYFGSRQSELWSALEKFTVFLTHVEADGVAEQVLDSSQPFDVAVIANPEKRLVMEALPLLREGGAIYWEIARSEEIAWLRHPDRYSRFLRKLGFQDIELHWHRPNFSSCVEIIPLDKPRSLSLAFQKRQVNIRGRLKFLIGKLLLRSGLLAYTIPCFSVVGIKNTIDRS